MDTTAIRTRLEEERERLLVLRDQGEAASRLDAEQAESSGALADYDQHPGDMATETFERTKDLAIRDQLDEHLADVDAALHRLDEGGYGQCETCGREIDQERLEARPATRHCREHQQLVDAAADAMRDEEGAF